MRARDLRAARLEGLLVQAKLDSLQGRLRPHFLFNTLNSIGALIQEQPAAAQQMLGSLSELLRASLHTEPSREVTLERELDLVRQYVSIQQMRFQDWLSVSIETEPDVLHAYVPHLVLQPLVENAIQHGIAPPGSARARADCRRPRGQPAQARRGRRWYRHGRRAGGRAERGIQQQRGNGIRPLEHEGQAAAFVRS